MPFARLKLLLVCSLIASTALFAAGVAFERSHHAARETSTGEFPHAGETGSEGGSTEGASGAESPTPAEPAATAEHSDSDAVYFGINVESWGLVAVAVLLSFALAFAVWFRPVKPVLVLAGVFGIAFAALDLAEVSHQVSASRAGLAAIAAVVALLHLSTAGLAVAASRVSDAV